MGLGVTSAAFVDLRNLGVEEAVELAADGVDVAPRMLDDPRAVGVEKEREKQVLDAHELVPTALCLAGGQAERDLDFGADSHRDLLRLGRHFERHLVFLRVLANLQGFGFGDVPAEHPCDPCPLWCTLSMTCVASVTES